MKKRPVQGTLFGSTQSLQKARKHHGLTRSGYVNGLFSFRPCLVMLMLRTYRAASLLTAIWVMCIHVESVGGLDRSGDGDSWEIKRTLS